MAPAPLFIVSRAEPELYTYMARRFGTTTPGQIILDRRIGPRRYPAAPRALEEERRRRARRGRPEIDVELESHGWVIVR